MYMSNKIYYGCRLMFANKGPVQYVSIQVVINKCFLLKPEKNFAQICLVVFAKNAKTVNPDALQFRKNDVTEPKARVL